MSFQDLIKELPPYKPEIHEWLPVKFSQAFLVCLGAGPWRFERRKDIQQLCLDSIGASDLTVFDSIGWYPLDWQNHYANLMIDHLKKNNIKMEEFCTLLLQDKQTARKKFYEALGLKKSIKVLSLFCRDSLKVPSFPIDRHVRRLLEKHDLPVEEDVLIELCQKERYNPVEIAIRMVSTGLNKGNPDWSKWQK